jgi:hypothetical protein
LVTLALLKTRFDEGKDHLGLLDPFIADAADSLSTNDFLAADVRKAVQERSGLQVPIDTVQTLLGRLAKRKYLRREGGRYFKTDRSLEELAFQDAKYAAQQDQAALGAALRSFAQDAGVNLTSDEEALLALVSFIADNKVPLVLAEPLVDSPLDRSSLSHKLTRTVARFISQRCVDDPRLRPALDGLLEGLILRDCLMLDDLADLGQQFQKLVVVLDTSILLAVLDLHGVAAGIAAREGLGLLRDTGATIIALEGTLAEIRRILLVYERKLATAEGRLSLYQTDLSRHVLANRLTPADIRMISTTLEQRLARVGIGVREAPKHDRRYTLDEEALAASLTDVNDNDTDKPRIRHDVDCVAAVLTIRAGRVTPSLERSKAVFCTTAGRVIRNVQQWYATQHQGGVPPIVHQLALTNIAWLKRPAAARGLKTQELLAACSAALRPRRSTWEKLMANLKKLRQEGLLSDDETVAVVASELTEPLLAQLDDDMEPDADTIQETIDRVRAAYRVDAERTARQAIDDAEAKTVIAQRAAADAMQRNVAIEAGIEVRVQFVAKIVSWACFVMIGLLLFGAAILAIPGVLDVVGPSQKLVARIVVAIAAVFGAVAAVKGTTIDDVRRAIHRLSARLIRRWLFGIRTPKVG